MRKELMVLFAATLLSAGAAAREAAETVPTEKVEIDNDQVRVIRITQPPHTISPMHSHPASVVIALGDAHLRFTYPDGHSEEVSARAGQARWIEPVTHKVENLADTPSEVIHIEVKQRAGH